MDPGLAWTLKRRVSDFQEKKSPREPCSLLTFDYSFLTTTITMSLKICGLVLATVGFAAAQSSVVSLFIPFADPQPLVASIMGEVRTDRQ